MFRPLKVAHWQTVKSSLGNVALKAAGLLPARGAHLCAAIERSWSAANSLPSRENARRARWRSARASPLRFSSSPPGGRPLRRPTPSYGNHKTHGSRFFAGLAASNATAPAIAIAASGGLGAAVAAAMAIYKARASAVPELADDIGGHSAHRDRQPQSLCMAWSSSFGLAEVRVSGVQPQSLRMFVLSVWLGGCRLVVSPSRCTRRVSFLSVVMPGGCAVVVSPSRCAWRVPSVRRCRCAWWLAPVAVHGLSSSLPAGRRVGEPDGSAPVAAHGVCPFSRWLCRVGVRWRSAPVAVHVVSPLFLCVAGLWVCAGVSLSRCA
jgi:hypothetical protein